MLSCSVVSNPLHQAPLFFTASWSLLKITFTESVMPSKHLILCRPVLLPSIFPSISVFSSELILFIRCPKYWSFSSNQFFQWIFIQGWFPLGLTRFDLLAGHRTLKSLLQHLNQKRQFFGTQPSLWSNSHICTWLMEKP